MGEQNQFSEKKAIAVLIDGENAQHGLVKEMLAEVGKYGRTTFRRIYGNWASSNMSGWKEVLQENAIQPMQQFSYAVGKNATDIALIIDAMDILHSGVVDGFCLVSSDSDFTRLAMRIREQGIFVMGIGEMKTTKSFTNACDLFVFTENLFAPTPIAGGTTKSPAVEPNTRPETEALVTLRNAFDLCVQENGLATLGALGHSLRKIEPSFDVRTYGCRNLKTLISKLSKHWTMLEEKNSNGTTVDSVMPKSK